YCARFPKWDGRYFDY
nr:immunoglobulin heavy chain junction region [Mus musculus]